MNLQSLNTLEYEIIKTELARHAVSYVGKKAVEELMPMTYLPTIQRAIEETSEAKELLERGSSVPIPSLEGIEWIMSLMGTGYLYNEQDFTAVATFLKRAVVNCANIWPLKSKALHELLHMPLR
ncbi:hypothetical protein ACDZ28_07970 [Paenibacillus sp. RS8]|uniref:hypothetical protein n=1 Tax=Paenibacillus sp. RS8 TaxID=3242681 RepID=UPI0035BEF158